MSRKTRYAVDPSLQFNQDQQQLAPQPAAPYPQQPYHQQQQHQADVPAPPPGQYAAPAQPRQRVWQEELQGPDLAGTRYDGYQQQPPPPQQEQVQPQPQQGLGYGSGTPPVPTNHISQPPHSAGPQLRGPKPRVDPYQVPSPVEAAEMDQNLYEREDYETCNTKGLVPLGTTDWRGVDQGNSLPRYIRSSLPHVPATSALLETSQLPFGLVIQPFAPPRYDEDPIPLITSFGNIPSTSSEDFAGPPRCAKCRGYISPWAKWFEGGQKWQCALCLNMNGVVGEYYSHVDNYGVRLDIQDRPELRAGTVDIEVGEKYWAENPKSDILDGGLSAAGDLMSALSEAVANTSISGGSLPPSSATTSPDPATHSGTLSRRQAAAALAKKKEQQWKEQASIRRPLPIGRIYALDVSWNAGRSGVLKTVCEGIREGLYGPNEPKEDADEWVVPPGRIAIVTFDRAVQFYDLSAGNDRAQMLVVSDLEDMFLPLQAGFLVDPTESRTQIEGLLQSLPDMFADTQLGEVALGAVAKGVLAGLSQQGGQLSIFLTSLPTFGPGSLKPREDTQLFGTDKEKALYAPADAFWRNTAEELSEAGVGVNVFFFPERYTDVASVGVLAGLTGGNVFFHPRFDPVRDRERVSAEIRRTLSPNIVYNATIRVRCSNGLRVASHSGSFHQRSLTDLEFGILDSDKAFTAVIRHEGKLDERDTAYMQTAVLYTSADGHRRVRLMNLSCPITNHIGNVFRFADFDTGMVALLQDAVTQAPQKGLAETRRGLTERCVRVLLMYRKHCAGATNPGQLILPESYKLMPLYTLSMIKSKALKGGHVSSDVRSVYLRILRSMSLPRAMHFLYPRMFSVHDLPASVGYIDDSNGRLALPTFLRASYAYMVADGAYMLINGEIAILWLGSALSPQILSDLYGVEDLQDLDTRMTSLPKIPSNLSVQLRNILAHMERVVGLELPVIVARQNMDGTEVEFANMLFEDSNNDALAYTEYLMSVHRSITDDLSGNNRSDGGWKTLWN